MKGLNLELANAGIELKNAGIREDELVDYISRSKISVIPVCGSFRYDFKSDVSTVDECQKKIFGFESDLITFADVFSKIDSLSRTLFEEQSIGSVGKHDIFRTNEFALENQNIISEVYKFDYHKDDYERNSPLTITGQTTLLRKVA